MACFLLVLDVPRGRVDVFGRGKGSGGFCCQGNCAVILTLNSRLWYEGSTARGDIARAWNRGSVSHTPITGRRHHIHQ